MSDPTDDAAALARVSAELDGVEAALGRLDSGEFGACEVCGAPIESDRVDTNPITTRCAAHENHQSRPL